MTTPQMTPYTPSLYQPDSYGRYRIYPRVTETPIPGAGFRVGELFWGEQQLNLDGSTRPQPYGSYATVPLRGLGQLRPELLKVKTAVQPGLLVPGSGDQGGAGPSEIAAEDYGFDAATEIAEAAAASQAAQDAAAQAALNEDQGGFLTRKVGPVPYWALGLGALAVLGGGGYVLLRRRRAR